MSWIHDSPRALDAGLEPRVNRSSLRSSRPHVLAGIQDKCRDDHGQIVTAAAVAAVAREDYEPARAASSASNPPTASSAIPITSRIRPSE